MHKQPDHLIRALVEALLAELWSEESVDAVETAATKAVPLKTAPSQEGRSPIKQIPELGAAVDLALKSASEAVGINATVAKLKMAQTTDPDAQKRVVELEKRSDALVAQLAAPAMIVRDFMTKLANMLPTALPPAAVNEIIANIKADKRAPGGGVEYLTASKPGFVNAIKSVKPDENVGKTVAAQTLQKTDTGFDKGFEKAGGTTTEEELGKLVKLSAGNISKTVLNLTVARNKIAAANVFVYLDICDVQPFTVDNDKGPDIKGQARAIKTRIYNETGMDRGELESLEQQYVQTYGGGAELMASLAQQGLVPAATPAGPVTQPIATARTALSVPPRPVAAGTQPMRPRTPGT